MYYGLAPLPSLTPEQPFCAYVFWDVSLTSRMRNMCSLYLLSKQDSAPSCSFHNLYLKVYVHRGQIPVSQPGTHLSFASISIKPGMLLESWLFSTQLKGKMAKTFKRVFKSVC